MLATPVFLATALVTILAIVLYFYMGVNAGRMRVAPPSSTAPSGCR